MAYRCPKCKSNNLRILCEIVCDLRAVPETEPRPIEDALTGATAYARSIEFQDARVDFEREAGKLLKAA